MISRGLAVRVSLGAAAALGLSVIVTAGLGTSGHARSGGAAASAPPPDVVIVGESLVHQVAPLEDRLLREAGYQPDIEARDSVDLASPFVQGQVKRAVARRTPIVVIETASNDAFLGAGTAPRSAWGPALVRYRRTLASTLAALSGQCTVLVDTRVNPTAKWYALDRIGPGIDQTIDASARAGSVEVVRWSSESAGHGSDWFWTDGLHFGDPAHANADWHPAGANAFVEAIAAGIRACSARAPG